MFNKSVFVALTWVWACSFVLSGCQSFSESEIRDMATIQRNLWIENNKNEGSALFEQSEIISIEKNWGEWHIVFMKDASLGGPEGMHIGYLHIYLNRAGKLRKVVRGPDAIS